MERLYAQAQFHVADRPRPDRTFCGTTPTKKAPGAQSRIISREYLASLSYKGRKKARHSLSNAPVSPHCSSRRSRYWRCHTAGQIHSIGRPSIGSTGYPPNSGYLRPAGVHLGWKTWCAGDRYEWHPIAGLGQSSSRHLMPSSVTCELMTLSYLDRQDLK
jgi:hypothetical protein